MKHSLLTQASMFAIWTFVSAQLPDGTDTLFRYGRSKPLDMRDSLIEATHSWNVFDVSYRSSRIGRVTGYLVTPSEKGRHAGILFGHWGPGNRTEFLPEAKLYAQAVVDLRRGLDLLMSRKDVDTGRIAYVGHS